MPKTATIMLAEILDELQRARSKFPEQNIFITLAALSEEVGELNQAVLQRNFENFVSDAAIYKEAVQVAVMAMRVALDCEYTIKQTEPRETSMSKSWSDAV